MARDINSVSVRAPLLPTIYEPIPKFVSIGALRNPITLCSWNDRPEVASSDTLLERYAVLRTQAFIDPLGPVSLEDHRVAYNYDLTPTHAIILRTPPDIFVDKNFWVYRKTRFGAQWYRVLRIEDVGERHRMIWLLVGLVRSNDIRLDPYVQQLPPESDVPIDVSENFL